MNDKFRALYHSIKANTLHMKHVWGRMQERHIATRGFRMKTITTTIKPPLSAETKQQRLEGAKRWCGRGRNKLLNVI